jgi:predicted helicase
MTKKAEIYYYRLPNCKSKQEKLQLLDFIKFKDLDFDRVFPDKDANWINQTDNDFDTLIPVCDKQTKLGKNQHAIFKLFSNGVSTNRDEWVYDFSKENLIEKMQFFFEEYNNEVDRWIKWKNDNNYQDIKDESNPVVDTFLHQRNLIKWSKMIKRDKLRKHKKGFFDTNDITNCLYRPFVKNYLYYGYVPIDIRGEFDNILSNKNSFIVFNNGELQPFNNIIVNSIVDLHFNGDSVCLPFYIYDKENKQQENITDWALEQFRKHYQIEITKRDIFNYVYAVLHDPKYREKYEQNLKREFPRIPFYDNFEQWVNFGKELIDLHLNYETVEKYPLQRIDTDKAKIPKAKLKADKDKGVIFLDDNTRLENVPCEAWDYKLGNRSALEWVLDQYKEKTPKDATIAEKFNTYCFADYKEQVIDLLCRVCKVSVETVRIVQALHDLSPLNS